jgi:hypothetical protein
MKDVEQWKAIHPGIIDDGCGIRNVCLFVGRVHACLG